jgi:hypothetical protein
VDGKIILFDRRHFKFFILNKDGKFLYSFGKRGEGPGEIKHMLNFYLVGDRILTYDLGKINFFSLDGKFEKAVPTSSTIGLAPIIFIDENRYVKTRIEPALNARPQSLEIYDLATKTTTYLEGKTPEVDKKEGRRGVMVMIQIGAGPVERTPGFVVGHFGDKLLWGKNDNYLIRSCNFSGKELFSFSLENREQKKITEELKERIASRAQFRTTGGGSPDDFKKRFMKSIPDVCTYFSQVVSGKNGLIYVYVSDAARENGQEIDIFSPEGKYLYQADIAFPEGQRIISNGLVFKDDNLFFVMEDEEGELSFNKYRVTTPPAK